MRKAKKASYHHGRLREALLESALELVQEQGAGAVSLREVARRAGVSHAAPAHHFGDKAGMLTALAVQGYELFTDALRAGIERAPGNPELQFAYTGLAYVMFAAEHRAHFELMFRPELLRRDDPALLATASAAYGVLQTTVGASFPREATAEDLGVVATTAWAQAHGLATLWLHGNLPQAKGLAELDQLARKVFGLPPA